MTCFWNGIIVALKQNMIKEHFGLNYKPNAIDFVKMLKQKATIPYDVLWNDQEISEQELKDGFKKIVELDPNELRYGYLCSACDPYLMLISHMFKVNIVHKFLNTVINYKYKYANNNTMTLKFGSDRGHFWCH